MATYQSEQSKLLLSFLERYRETPMTIAELIREMERAGGEAVPGESTVYRLMKKLVVQGRVKRFVRGDSRQFLYQLVEGEACHGHLHLKCIKCGKLFHMDDETTRLILEQVQHRSRFAVDRAETVLFGDCKGCL